MNAPDKVRLDAYRRALGYAIYRMEQYAQHSGETRIAVDDLKWIWRELGAVGETPIHIERGQGHTRISEFAKRFA